VPRGIRAFALTRPGNPAAPQPLGWLAPRILLSLPQLVRVASAHDLIMAAGEFGGPIYLGALLARFARRPLVASALGEIFSMTRLAGTWRARVHRLLLPAAYRSATAVLAISEGSKLDLVGRIPDIADRVTVVYAPVRIEEARASAAAPLPPSVPSGLFSLPVVLGWGRTEYRKGFDLLVRAHAQVISVGGPAHHLAIMGPPADEDVRLRRLARDLGVAGSVIFLGFQENPFPIVKRSAIFAFPSRVEGLGVALVQAMALGVPPVVSDCSGGPVEVVSGGACGVVVPCGSTERLAEELKILLERDEERARIGQLAAARAESFSRGSYMQKIESVLGSAIGLA